MTVPMSPEEIGKQARQIREDLLSGKLSLGAVTANPVDVAGNYGIEIPKASHEHLTAHVQSIPGCAACDIGLTIAIAGLAELAIVAVAAVVVVFAPEFALVAVLAFLSSAAFLATFAVIEGVIIAGAGGLAAYLCHALIKC
jgi:hypothetical protein